MDYNENIISLICTECKATKNVNCFYISYSKKMDKKYFNSKCKECILQGKKDYYNNNRDMHLKRNKEWRLNNREIVKQIAKDTLESRKIWMKNKYNNDSEYREKIKQKVKNYRNNPENKEALQKTRKISRTKYKQDPYNRLVMNLRRVMSHVLDGNRKADFSMKMVGCTHEELKAHLTSLFKEGMSWDNYGKKENNWCIDHIIPCCSFDLTIEEQQRKCFHYTNLQPLWYKDNAAKGAEDKKSKFKF